MDGAVSFEHIIKMAKNAGPVPTAIIAAHNIAILKAVQKATQECIIQPIFIGNEEKIRQFSDDIGFDISTYELLSIDNPIEATIAAVDLVNKGRAKIIMKGQITTRTLMHTIIVKRPTLMKGGFLSHFAISNVPGYHKLLSFSDAALNISPGLKEKVEILKNAVTILHHLGYTHPKVAVLSSMEVVNPKIESSVHAAEIAKMNKENTITGCIVDGPFALDNAISATAAKNKSIQGPVAGDADFLLLPNLDSGNLLYKSISFLVNAPIAAFITGAKAPIVLTSRADNENTKYLSIALAAATLL
jgi:phosphate butyryltransferase